MTGIKQTSKKSIVEIIGSYDGNELFQKLYQQIQHLIKPHPFRKQTLDDNIQTAPALPVILTEDITTLLNWQPEAHLPIRTWQSQERGKKRKILSKFEAFSNELNLSPINKCKTHPLLTGTDLFNLPRGKLNKELALLESVRTTVCRCSQSPTEELTQPAY